MTPQQYLKDHTISEDFVKNEGWTWVDKKINIPVVDLEGKFLFTKERNLDHIPHNKDPDGPPKYHMPKGVHAALFNYLAVKDRSYIIICEGEMDCIRLKQDNIPAVSSTNGAESFTKEWAELLEGKKVFICLDNDPTGKKGIDKIVEFIPEAKIVVLPDKIKDVCEYFASGKTVPNFIALVKEALTPEEWKLLNEPEEYKLINAKEICALEFEEQPWLIEKILYMEGFCFIYGSEGVGKSFITLSIADAIANGKKWLDQFNVPKAVKVLFIDKENPMSILSKRLKNMSMDSENIYWVKQPAGLTLVDNKGELSKFAISIAEKVESQGISLIVIDSFVDLMVGSENSAEETQKFFSAIRVMFPNKAILVLHHESKQTQGVFRSDAQKTRGSTNINAQAITQFRIEAIAKSKTDLTIKQTKARDAQKLDKFMIRMKVESVEGGNDETKVVGFDYVGIVAGEKDDTGKMEEAKNLIKEILTDDINVNRKVLINSGEGAGISESTMDRVLREMTKDGLIEKIKNGRDVYYSDNVSVKTQKDEDE